MRICLYTATAHPKLGGQEAVVDALASHLTLLGHRAVVLAPRPRLPMRPRDGELPYPVYRHPRFFSTKYFVPFYRRFLLGIYAKEQFDVLHCHDVYPTGYVAALCRDRLAVPMVITSHGGDVKEGNIRISKPGMLPRYVRAIEAADALISIGNFTTAGFTRLHPGKPRIVPIPNGIDLAPFAAPAPRPHALDADIQANSYILFLGRLHPRKGADVLLEAMARLPIEESVNCVIAGSGDQRAELESQARALGIGTRVRFAGRVEGTAKIWLLQNAICVVMPSRVWEAFPMVLMESYAAGKAVIGSRIPGIEDLVEEGRTGLLVPQESPEALARAIRTLVTERRLAGEWGENARRIAQSYSWESIARQHMALYEQLHAERLMTADG
ncbi:MAG TPA: glycosyltransferase family 4 protein [Tepidisphaeraceae bacterium]|nr:glycosyltransferase family 4 protein [Tepidisphaeraceae bacterium]